MKAIACSVFLFAGLSFFLYNCNRIFAFLKTTQFEDRFKNIPERIGNVFLFVFGQSKLLREPVAGSIHFAIFWGFIALLLNVIESIAQGFSPLFSFRFFGGTYFVLAFIQEVCGLLVIIAVIAAFSRKYILKVKRLALRNGKNQLDALIVLSLIFLIMLSMFGQNVSQLALNQNGFTRAYHPVSSLLLQILPQYGNSNFHLSYETFWWMHLGCVMIFLNFLPYSKHFHIITSGPNVFFAKTKDQKNQIKHLDFSNEEVDSFGASDVRDLTWKQILDGYSCTECGRCDSVCPAVLTGKSLSPRKIAMDIRERFNELIVNDATGKDRTLLHGYITEQELWQCTTCSACQTECPVMIEHVDTIIDLRRSLVLSESKFPPELNNLFRNLEVQGNPWGNSIHERGAWADGLHIPTMAENPEHEYLFWVGCSGAYDSRYIEVTKAFAGIMKAAGVDFAILGNEEKCTGDVAKRLGNDYLAQELAAKNVETLNRYKIKKIVTACPHCFNSLKTDFNQVGGEYEVIHHTELIENLIKTGKINFSEKSADLLITYHDSCYIGRYYNNFDAPRESLTSIPGVTVTEMERNKSRGLCCGAGGGMMFVEDTQGKRINDERALEAMKTNARVVGTACPFCMNMLTNGLMASKSPDKVEVRDIAEVVWENIKDNN